MMLTHVSAGSTLLPTALTHILVAVLSWCHSLVLFTHTWLCAEDVILLSGIRGSRDYRVHS